MKATCSGKTSLRIHARARLTYGAADTSIDGMLPSKLVMNTPSGDSGQLHVLLLAELIGLSGLLSGYNLNRQPPLEVANLL
jgi:hypothetical protein